MIIPAGLDLGREWKPAAIIHDSQMQAEEDPALGPNAAVALLGRRVDGVHFRVCFRYARIHNLQQQGRMP
jgi:hypothetical protein